MPPEQPVTHEWAAGRATRVATDWDRTAGGTRAQYEEAVEEFNEIIRDYNMDTPRSEEEGIEILNRHFKEQVVRRYRKKHKADHGGEETYDHAGKMPLEKSPIQLKFSAELKEAVFKAWLQTRVGHAFKNDYYNRDTGNGWMMSINLTGTPSTEMTKPLEIAKSNIHPISELISVASFIYNKEEAKEIEYLFTKLIAPGFYNYRFLYRFLRADYDRGGITPERLRRGHLLQRLHVWVGEETARNDGFTWAMYGGDFYRFPTSKMLDCLEELCAAKECDMLIFKMAFERTKTTHLVVYKRFPAADDSEDGMSFLYIDLEEYWESNPRPAPSGGFVMDKGAAEMDSFNEYIDNLEALEKEAGLGPRATYTPRPQPSLYTPIDAHHLEWNAAWSHDASLLAEAERIMNTPTDKVAVIARNFTLYPITGECARENYIFKHGASRLGAEVETYSNGGSHGVWERSEEYDPREGIAREYKPWDEKTRAMERLDAMGVAYKDKGDAFRQLVELLQDRDGVVVSEKEEEDQEE